MTSPIQTLAPGERPTEPGWYVIETVFGRKVVQIGDWGPEDRLQVLRMGDYQAVALDEAIDDGLVLIARIFPDRIGQE